jgi:hypothetical protein
MDPRRDAGGGLGGIGGIAGLRGWGSAEDMIDGQDFLRSQHVNAASSYGQPNSAAHAAGQQLFASDSGSARASPPPIGVYAQGVGSADMSMYAQSVPQMSYGQVPLQVTSSQPAQHADQSHDLHSIYGTSQGFAGMPAAFQSVAQASQAPPSQSRGQAYSMPGVQQDYANLGSYQMHAAAPPAPPPPQQYYSGASEPSSRQEGGAMGMMAQGIVMNGDALPASPYSRDMSIYVSPTSGRDAGASTDA